MVFCYFHLRRVFLNYKQLIPILCKHEDGGKQERRNETTFMDLIRSNKKGLRYRWFCSFQCFKIWPDCLNFKHWPILSSASGALLIFTVKSTLNYTRVLRQSTKKKKEAINNTQIRRHCMRHLIRTVWELIYQIWDRQTVLIKTKKKRKKMGAFKRCILLSLSVKRPLIFWTRRLHLDVLQSQCIHMCHTNGLILSDYRYWWFVLIACLPHKGQWCVIFWQCFDNDVINLCCGRLPLFICLSNIHVKWPFRAF